MPHHAETAVRLLNDGVRRHGPAGIDLLAGACGGVIGWAAWLHWTLTAGGSPAAGGAFWTAAAVTTFAGACVARRWPRAGNAAPFAVAASVSFVPAGFAAVESVLRAVPNTAYLGVNGFPVLFAAAVAAVGPFAVAAGLWSHRAGAARFWCGAAAGVTLAGIVPLPAATSGFVGTAAGWAASLGVHPLAAGAAVLLVVVAATRRSAPRQCAPAGAASGNADETSGLRRPAAGGAPRQGARRGGASDLSRFAVLLSAAALAVPLTQLAWSLTPATAPAHAAATGGMLAGLALGLFLATRRFVGRFSNGTMLAGAAAVPLVGAAAVMGGYGLLADQLLSVHAFVSDVRAGTLLRAAVVAGFTLPCGVGCGLAAGRAAGSSRVGLPAVLAGGVTVGAAAGAWCGAEPAAGLSACVLLLAAAVPTLVRSRNLARPAAWAGPLVGAASLAVVLSVTPDRDGAEHRLFSTRAALARQGGVTDGRLDRLDDARRVAAVDEPAGRTTLHRDLGTRLTVRRGGVPVGTLSVQPSVTPRDSAAVMRAVLPLAICPRPHRVLVLGGGTPEVPAACTRFPIVSLRCVDGRPAAVAALREEIRRGRGVDPFADGRVDFVPVDPPLGVRADRGEYDVILCETAPGASLDAAACDTAEFLAAAAERLAADGVLCRRFATVDYGPAVLRTAAATMKQVFPHVLAVEVGFGEYALLGTRADGGFDFANVGRRLSKPHTRRLLAEVGWDWSVPLNLPVLSDESCVILADGFVPAAAADGRFASAWPAEVQRWADKAAERGVAVSGGHERLLTRLPPGTSGRAKHRLSEVVAARELIARSPDQPWAYRKLLRERVAKQSRSVVEPVAGQLQKRIHPEDRRRLAFFEAVGLANADPVPTPGRVHALLSYREPHDPLVAPFAAGEAVRLCEKYRERTGRDDLVPTEFTARLAAIRFAPSQDRSVRDVAAAIELLAAHPDAVPDPADRFDQFNGLVQTLKARWELRGRVTPADPGVVLIDLRRSLDAVDTALTAMKPLAGEIGLPGEVVADRAAFLSGSLVGPLRAYRGRLVSQHRRALRDLEDGRVEAVAERLMEEE